MPPRNDPRCLGPNPADSPLRILLVDDRPENLLALEGLLADLGHTLVRAASGAEALKRLLQEEFAVILMDVQMPDLDGYQTAQLIRSREASRCTPIIFITAGKGSPEDIAYGYSLGAVDYITKPLNASELRGKVGSLVELSRNTVLLQQEVTRRLRAEAESRRLNQELEERVQERTAALEAEMARRQRIEAALRESEALYRGVSEAVPDFIWSCWADGRADFVNRRWMEYTGLTVDTPNVGLVVLHHPDDIPQLVATMEQAAQSGQSYEAEFRYRRNDGVYRWFLARAVPIKDEAGQVVKWVGTSTDIHERKMAEEKLLKRQRDVEALNERLNRAMMETHHRVRNNLQIIAALADLCTAGEERLVSVEEVHRIGDQVRALAAIHDLLTKEANCGGDAEHLSAGGVLTSLVGLVRQSVGANRVRLSTVDTPLSTPRATALMVIANELILNALKNSADTVDVSLEADGDTLTLVVADHGPGFPADFDPVAAASTGLELVKSVATWDLHGSVAFGNRPGGGGVVTVRFAATHDDSLP